MEIIDRYKDLDIPGYVNDWAYELHKDFINTLYYPSIYIFPLTAEGEELMDLFFREDIISYKYGAYTLTNKCPIDGEIYNIVIENND